MYFALVLALSVIFLSGCGKQETTKVVYVTNVVTVVEKQQVAAVPGWRIERAEKAEAARLEILRTNEKIEKEMERLREWNRVFDNALQSSREEYAAGNRAGAKQLRDICQEVIKHIDESKNSLQTLSLTNYGLRRTFESEANGAGDALKCRPFEIKEVNATTDWKIKTIQPIF